MSFCFVLFFISEVVGNFQWETVVCEREILNIVTWYHATWHQTLTSKLSKHLCLRRGVKINEGFKLRHTEKLCVSVFMHVHAGMCLKDVVLCVFKSPQHYFYHSVLILTCISELPMWIATVFQFTLTCCFNLKPTTMCLGEGMCVLSPHLAMCMCGARWAEVTVRVEQQKNDLQGLLSLISIQGKKIDKDHHFADGSAPCFFFPNQEESVVKKKKKKAGETDWGIISPEKAQMLPFIPLYLP